MHSALSFSQCYAKQKINLACPKVKYTLSMHQIYCKYSSKVYLKYTSSVLEAYLKHTLSILQPAELQKKKYSSSLYYFDKKSTFEAHFGKLNQHFNVNLKCTLSLCTCVLSRSML